MFLRILDRLEEILIASLIAAATLLIFVAVVHRYCTGVPFLYPYLLPFQSVLGAGALHLHVRVDGEVRRRLWRAHRHPCRRRRGGQQLQPKPRKKVVLFGLFCGALFTFVVGTMGAKFVMELYPTDQVSPDLELPRWIVFLCVPLGSYLMCFRFLQVAWAFWRTGELPHHDPGHVEGVDRKPVRGAGTWPDEQRHHLRAADRADADRHADLDRARPHRADLPVHDDARCRSRRWR